MKRRYIILIGLFILIINKGFSQDFPTRGEVFDFEVGDIFHTQFSAYASGGSGLAENKNIEILSKYYSNNDSVVYYGRFIRGEVSTPDYPDWQYYEEFDTISYEFLYDTIFADTVYEDENQYNGRKTTFSHNYDTLYYTHNTLKYSVGCGKVYQEYDEMSGSGSAYSELELVYFKKGDEEWGEEQTIVGTKDILNNNGKTLFIKAFPNPTVNQLTFEFPQINEISWLLIYDIYGNTIAEHPLIKGEHLWIWDCSNVLSGVYFYHTQINGEVYRGKIIIN